MPKKNKPQLPGPYALTQTQVEQIKHEFEEAKKVGDPIAALAEQIAKMDNIITVQGESLGTLIPDTSIKLDIGKFLPRPPDFIITPDGAVRNILHTTEPAFVKDGLEIHPERLVRDYVIINDLPCPSCHDSTEKPGWNVEAPDTPHGMSVVQCLKCHQYIGIERGKPETEEPTD